MHPKAPIPDRIQGTRCLVCQSTDPKAQLVFTPADVALFAHWPIVLELVTSPESVPERLRTLRGWLWLNATHERWYGPHGRYEVPQGSLLPMEWLRLANTHPKENAP